MMRSSGATDAFPRGPDVYMDKEDPENCAPDWVWIGRETLERNAINTGCSEALMPEADFNGNNTPPGGGAGSGGTVTRASGSSGTSGYGNSGSFVGINNGDQGSARNSFIASYKGR